ncbi:MAG: phosphate acyltransferase [Bacteroidota bacterium]
MAVCLRCYLDDPDGLVSGLTQHYPDTISPALRIINLREGVNMMAGLCVLRFKKDVYFIADATVNFEFTAQQLAEIRIRVAEEVEGSKCYASIRDLQVRPDVVVIVVKPEQTISVLNDCVARHVKRVFFQQGSESRQAIDFCDANGITAMYGACAIQYFAPHGDHRLHTWLGNVLFLKPRINSPQTQREILS